MYLNQTQTPFYHPYHPYGYYSYQAHASPAENRPQLQTILERLRNAQTKDEREIIFHDLKKTPHLFAAFLKMKSSADQASSAYQTPSTPPFIGSPPVLQVGDAHFEGYHPLSIQRRQWPPSRQEALNGDVPLKPANSQNDSFDQDSEVNRLRDQLKSYEFSAFFRQKSHEESMGDLKRENDDLRGRVRALELQLQEQNNDQQRIHEWKKTRTTFQNALHSKAEFEQLRTELEELRERYDQKRNECVVCIENEPTILFSPCNHMICCVKCAPKIDNDICPTCRSRVLAKIRVFKA